MQLKNPSFDSMDQRITVVRVTVVIGFLLGIALSVHLWFPPRFFPTIPVADVFQLPEMVDAALSAVIILLLLFYALTNIRLALLPLAFLLLLSLLSDQMRWQPWAYIYLLVLFTLAFYDHKNAGTIVFCLQLIFIGVYCWSGIYKLNREFIDHSFTRGLLLLLNKNDTALLNQLKPLGYLIGLIEIFIGIGLGFVKTRVAAVYVAIASHTMILLYLGPLGLNENSIVYPWNLVMMILVIAVFHTQTNGMMISFPSRGMKTMASLIYLLTWILPVLNFAGAWDHYLSFSLYSDRASTYYVAVDDHSKSMIDPRFQQYRVDLAGITGGVLIGLNEWALGELNVPFYPQDRAFRKVASHFCEYGIENERLIFLELKRPLAAGQFSKLTCADLGRRD